MDTTSHATPRHAPPSPARTLRPRLMVPYSVHRTTDLAALASAVPGGVDLFAEPGPGVKLGDYAAWLKLWRTVLTAYTNLPVPGDTPATRSNQRALEGRGLEPVPVIRVGEPWRELDEILAAYPYVAVTGLGVSLHPARLEWLRRIFAMAGEHDTALHGYQIAATQFLADAPFYSADTAVYLRVRRQPVLALWDADRRQLRRSNWRDSGSIHKLRHLYRTHGLDPAEIADPMFLNRSGHRNYETDTRILTDASARAWMMLGDWLARRHHAYPPPLERHADRGTKIYLALWESDTAFPRRLVTDTPA